ncbi:MAG TPA: CCA tRNA nucleotidyltransferase [Chroococcidiopsis sp.]
MSDITLLERIPSLASTLSPQTWPFALSWLPQAAYLVGGNVRDALLGRSAEYLDLDFVLPTQAVETARAIAKHYQAGFVLLDAERQIARVVFDKATVDFAQQVGDSLEEDLQRRDFTVNAIAYHPMTEHLLDPLQGYADLQKGLIRMIAPENLKEDPLRLLRAYRQSAQLGFALESCTQDTIRQLAPLLQFIAAERIQAELNYLLSTARATPFLTEAWTDGLLAHWLPSATPDNVALLGAIDQAAIALENLWSVFGTELTAWARDQPRTSGTRRSWLKVAKLACLVDPSPERAESELWHLKYSRLEIQAVVTILKALPYVRQTALTDLSRREQYYFFREVGAVFPSLTVLAVALGAPVEAIAPLMERFLNPNDPVAHSVPLLTGRDLMQALNLSPGPQIGHLLDAIHLAQAEGFVTNRETALEFAKRHLDGEVQEPIGLK